MSLQKLIFVTLACVCCLSVQATNRGYSLSFQGTNAIASTKKIINWTEDGMFELGNSTSYTFNFWVKYEGGAIGGSLFSFASSMGGGIDFKHIASYIFGVPLLMEKFGFDPTLKMQEYEEWHFISIVVDNGAIRCYMNGTLTQERYPVLDGAWPQARRLSDFGDTQFLFGAAAAVQTPVLDYPTSDVSGFGAFHQTLLSQIDEFSIWSIALTPAEILQIMTHSIDTSDLPEKLVVYYNFDVVGCNGVGKTLYEDNTCDITGTGSIQNFGSSGRNFDLILGQVNDDHGYGKYYYYSKEEQASVGQTYRFGFPTICIDSPPTFPENTTIDHVHTPMVFQLVSESEVQIDFPASFVPHTMGTVPLYGSIVRGSNKASVLSQNDDISGETHLFFISPANFETLDASYGSIILKDGSGNNHEQQVHVWPFKKPGFVDDTPKVKAGVFSDSLQEGGNLWIVGKNFAYSSTGESLDIKIVQYPENGEQSLLVFQLMNRIIQGMRYLTFNFYPPTNDTITNDIDGLLMDFRPLPGFFGVDTMKVKFVSPTSGLESDIFTMKLNVLMIDDLPYVESTTNPINISEDNENGTLVPIIANDQEKLFGLYAAVTTLPKKGKLYHIKANNSRQLVENAHSIYDVGKPF